MINTLKSLTLVACASLKHTQPSPAKQLYRSPWFIKAKTYIEQQDWNWYILSAHYGLLHPEQVIEPYDLTLNKMSIQQRRQWAAQVFEQLEPIVIPGSEVRFFAGERYRKHLAPMLEQAGCYIEIPLIGLGIGQQLAWFNAHSILS